MNQDNLIIKIVNRYIGVEGGYLGDFSYRTHRDFYPEYCDLSKDPDAIEGTTRERFISIFLSSAPRDQAKIIKGVIERFPTGQGPSTRTVELRESLLGEAHRLESLGYLDDPLIYSAAYVVEILDDAASLIANRSAASAVDRVHTAFHGYLREVCSSQNIEFTSDDGIVKLLKKMFSEHPKLRIETKSQEIRNIVRSLASIADSLNPVRNQASRTHPNIHILEEPEAVLVINTVRTMLAYIESKLK
jgi:hypothetical protein